MHETRGLGLRGSLGEQLKEKEGGWLNLIDTHGRVSAIGRALNQVLLQGALVSTY